ncbi:hypothetical protein LCGC14_0524670 [marine sediment metagenome]|uniref:Uncharacterized protein n=1 Tax=marine sediment metagenome TaxID=412755 RepID=A0A0F9SFT5_9ZZZZ
MGINVQKNKQELNTLNVLLQSLRFQLAELNKTNQKIESLKTKSIGGVNRKKD